MNVKLVSWLVVCLFSAVCCPSSNTSSAYKEKLMSFASVITQGLEDALGNLVEGVEDLISDFISVGPANVTVYLYNKSSVDEYIVKFTLADTSAFAPNFHVSKKTVVVVHGWLSDYTSEMNIVLRRAFLKNYDVNVAVIDWPTKTGYVYAYDSVPIVGQHLGEWLFSLNETFNYPPSMIHLVGHSLGAHVCGVAGKAMQGLAGAIIGLDPAGPLFHEDETDNRLTPYDAVQVQAIHTNGKLFGVNYPVGKSDFWPNGGMAQRGCDPLSDLISVCSHDRSYLFYAESVASGKFFASDCMEFELYGSCDCNFTSIAYMGEYRLDKRAEGNYFLNTSSSFPYSTLETEILEMVSNQTEIVPRVWKCITEEDKT